MNQKLWESYSLNKVFLHFLSCVVYSTIPRKKPLLLVGMCKLKVLLISQLC